MQWQGLILHAAERSQKQAKQMRVFGEDANGHIFQRIYNKGSSTQVYTLHCL